jgi:hypothetical protein
MSSATFPRFTFPVNLGAMSTATIASQVSETRAQNAEFYFVSTFNANNPPEKQYKFKSESERVQFLLGRLNLICGRNVQNSGY